ncbi:hypothetical protein ABZ815_38245 [Nonomuraea sp. NPDC047529]|uniref:hypothetical protein n=1 Tax=Nonomuraea sp. NPDC047529 TaxID=3155623 RepID=UPI00340A477B
MLVGDPALGRILRESAQVSDFSERVTTYLALSGVAPFDDLDCRRAVLLAAAVLRAAGG